MSYPYFNPTVRHIMTSSRVLSLLARLGAHKALTALAASAALAGLSILFHCYLAGYSAAQGGIVGLALVAASVGAATTASAIYRHGTARAMIEDIQALQRQAYWAIDTLQNSEFQKILAAFSPSNSITAALKLAQAKAISFEPEQRSISFSKLQSIWRDLFRGDFSTIASFRSAVSAAKIVASIEDRHRRPTAAERGSLVDDISAFA